MNKFVRFARVLAVRVPSRLFAVQVKGRPVLEVQENIRMIEVPDEKPKDLVKKTGLNIAMKNLKLDGTTIVRTKEDARKVVAILKQYPERIAAWDTETIGIDPKIQSPVGNGQVICASAFIGPDINFGNGPRLLIDNFADAEGTLMEFKEYFESEDYLKCWHNYGFDRHILFNHGIDCKGFGGDTMHMARLFDPSLMPGSYSLER